MWCKGKNLKRTNRLYKRKSLRDWTPDVIVDRDEVDIGYNAEPSKDSSIFDISTLPMQGKCKLNDHIEKCGK